MRLYAECRLPPRSIAVQMPNVTDEKQALELLLDEVWIGITVNLFNTYSSTYEVHPIFWLCGFFLPIVLFSMKFVIFFVCKFSFDKVL